MITWRRMRWAGHVAHMGRSAYRVLVENLEGKRPVGRLYVGRRIILKWILEK
jgi:hypothetical protein